MSHLRHKVDAPRILHGSVIHCISKLSRAFISFYFSPDEKAGIHLVKAVPFCQSLGSLVAIYNTAWSWDIIIVYCLIFRLHYTLLQRFRSHAEAERKPFHWINIYDCIICQHLQRLTQTVMMVSGQ